MGESSTSKRERGSNFSECCYIKGSYTKASIVSIVQYLVDVNVGTCIPSSLVYEPYNGEIKHLLTPHISCRSPDHTIRSSREITHKIAGLAITCLCGYIRTTYILWLLKKEICLKSFTRP